MRQLLDTNVFLGAIGQPKALSAAQLRILSSDAELLVSTATLLELAMLHRVGKLIEFGKGYAEPTTLPPARLRQAILLPGPYLSTVRRLAKESGIAWLPISQLHAEAVTRLPLHPERHNDPMDLLIIGQAIAEHVPLLSVDTKFPWYAANTALQLVS